MYQVNEAIPEKYKKMSVSELRYGREKIYSQIKKEKDARIKKAECRKDVAMFRF